MKETVTPRQRTEKERNRWKPAHAWEVNGKTYPTEAKARQAAKAMNKGGK